MIKFVFKIKNNFLKKVIAKPVGSLVIIGPSDDRELAQLVERHPYKVDVAGSNPVLPTILDF